MHRRSFLALALAASFAFTGVAQAFEVLPSWNDGESRRAIVAFVEAVTRPGPAFVPTEARVAVFDNDGTLWSEQPIYTEVAYALEKAGVKPQSEKDILAAVASTHSGMTTEAFARDVAAWLKTARNPKTGRLYLGSVYKPMLELMDYLRANGFAVYIVSGGDTDFMRTFAQGVYGVPPERVIGSSNETEFKQQGGHWVLERTPKMDVDDKAAKPSNIAQRIGRRPIFAAGNSDGDLQMLQYATSGDGCRMGLIVHHDDAAREFAYDRQSKIGTLDAALDEAARSGWMVVSMKADWRTIFP